MWFSFDDHEYYSHSRHGPCSIGRYIRQYEWVSARIPFVGRLVFDTCKRGYGNRWHIQQKHATNHVIE
jgi:hypothetical protein